MKPSPKRHRFVQEYLVHLNATQAAIRAGYSAGPARLQGHRMITNDNIKKNIQEAMDARAERTGITADRVLQELSLIGFANIADYLDVDIDGHPSVDLSNLTRDQAAAIEELSIENIGHRRKIKFKLSDKLPALIAMLRHLEMSTARAERDR
jgi:phage terminase small subunit